ncbi:hypothetical protein A9507_13430 [Methanobacterium sp. A39]|uniref:Uncharacterized protein n=1 Tax=Methanobacterium bryantii TaxID=2161 RepID=A0A2A2H4Y6_METBR|nr:hypothetical protein A9507_13430 [Methanobacterium sp. A39]PAV04343.1 hypothetical protein ASJ80_05715 [Methanobacterium bryantii]
MEKMHFSIVIDAPKEKVWKTMLDRILMKNGRMCSFQIHIMLAAGVKEVKYFSSCMMRYVKCREW